MAHKKRFVHGYVLETDNAFVGFELQDAVHQEKWWAVWENLLYLIDIEGHWAPWGSLALPFAKSVATPKGGANGFEIQAPLR